MPPSTVKFAPVTKPELQKELTKQVAKSKRSKRIDTATAAPGQLPHTGFNAGLLGLAGLLLLGSGIGLRRLGSEV